jgi:hypothetical protein
MKIKNRKIEFCCFLFAFAFLLLSCKHSQQGETSPKQKPIEYISFIGSIKNFDWETLSKQKLDSNETMFSQIIGKIISNNYTDAIYSIEKILDSKSSPFFFELHKLRTNALFYLAQWNKLIPNLSGFFSDPDSVFLLARAFALNPPEEISFKGELDSMSIDLSPSGTPIVAVEINGKKRYFWFDTGTNYSVISSEIASECNVTPIINEKSKALTAANYKIDAIPTNFKTLQIGNIIIRNHPALIVDDYNLRLRLFGPNKLTKIDGIIGWRVLKYARFTIDHPKRRLIIQKSIQSNKPNETNFFWSEIPIVVAKFHNIPLLFGLDLGSERSTLTYNIFNKINFTQIYQQTKVQGSVGGWKYNPSAVVPYFEMVLGKSKVTFKDINTVELPKEFFFNIDGFLGADFINGRITTLDLQNGIFEIREGK